MSATPLPRPRPTTGFVKDPRDAFEHWPRLLSGATQWAILKFIQHEEPFDGKSTSTRPITHAEIAAYCRCTVRAVEIKVKDLIDRKVLEGKRTSNGFRYHIPFEKWPGLPDMEQVVELEPELAATEETHDPEVEAKAKRVQLFEKPQVLEAGKRSKAIEMAGLAPDKCSVKTSVRLTYNVEVNNGTVVFHVLGGEEEAKREERAKPNRTNGRFASTEVPQNTQLSNFHTFESVWLKYGINAAPDDWAAARAVWVRMDTAEQLTAVKGVEERFYLGEYDPKEPKWIPLPQNYLQKKLWLRPIRGKAPAKVKVFSDEATVIAARKWAREQDRKAGRS